MKVLALTYKDSTDYLGNLILKNNHPSQYLFDGGYASFDADTLDNWHYYVQDYMGNNRMVVNVRDNSVEQETKKSEAWTYDGFEPLLNLRRGLY